MKLPSTKISLWRPAVLLLAWTLSLACSLLSGAPSTTAPDQPTRAATSAAGPATQTAKSTDTPGSQTVATTTAGPYTPAVSDRYDFFETKVTIAQSLAARAGQLWIGTVSGTIEEVDPQTGAFGKSISLAPQSGGGVGMPMAYPIQKMAFEGDYLWIHAGFFEGPLPDPKLFAIDPDSGEIVQEWDLNSAKWMQNYERGGEAADFGFGVSPGKIWIDGHIVDTKTFEVTQAPAIPTIMTLYAYDGKEWMWITGELGGSCDDLILINVNDPTITRCEDHWPFFSEEADGMGNPMVLTGDKIWMAGDWDGSSVLEAYPADIEQGMETTGPLLSVPLMDNPSSIKLSFARDSLWVLDTLGDSKIGWLFQVDPQTGETVNGLDLIGDEARALGDLPMDIATAGDDLWVLTGRQLLRIKLP